MVHLLLDGSIQTRAFRSTRGTNETSNDFIAIFVVAILIEHLKMFLFGGILNHLVLDREEGSRSLFYSSGVNKFHASCHSNDLID